MPLTGPQLVHAIKRNFGGLEESGVDPEPMFRDRLPGNIDEPPEMISVDSEVSTYSQNFNIHCGFLSS